MATTEKLMAQYGVAWFGFDESSGNIVDKLGNGYVGTPSNILRLSGWNGEGYSASFNGTSSVITQTAPMPDREVAIRFKFKTNVLRATDMYFLTTLNSYKDQKGMAVGIANGKFHIAWTSSANVYCVRYESSDNFTDNQWHDVFISWDGKQGSLMCIYIDDMKTPHAVLRTQSSNNGHLYPTFAIGRPAGITTAGWYGGELDDLQIYNKALSPSDFEQKRLVVKTKDNKNLVLSPNSARVKEIPSTVEYMMLAQGGVVKEIDSAVDSQPIDFTKPTTEYEIVSNNRTPLGKGKMFNIPIGYDFKTAMIEDNY
ncbi:LamG-like jellyroll fold domain-containing protein [Lysinibacillus sphaericus]|uniref:LamG-like jellyroll fold domain-containing protein n=1 Tax=Lysinibacillus sphaericus TaxID=1421 RepID=UPI003F7AC5D6